MLSGRRRNYGKAFNSGLRRYAEASGRMRGEFAARKSFVRKFAGAKKHAVSTKKTLRAFDDRFPHARHWGTPAYPVMTRAYYGPMYDKYRRGVPGVKDLKPSKPGFRFSPSSVASLPPRGYAKRGAAEKVLKKQSAADSAEFAKIERAPLTRKVISDEVDVARNVLDSLVASPRSRYSGSLKKSLRGKFGARAKFARRGGRFAAVAQAMTSM